MTTVTLLRSLKDRKVTNYLLIEARDEFTVQIVAWTLVQGPSQSRVLGKPPSSQETTTIYTSWPLAATDNAKCTPAIRSISVLYQDSGLHMRYGRVQNSRVCVRSCSF